jgi:putative membrane protein
MHRVIRTPLFLALLSGSVLVAAQGQQTQPQQQTQQQAQPMRAGQPQAAVELNRKDRKFVETALSANAAEIELGRLAEQRATSDQIRQLGQMMQQHHRSANEQLAALSPQHTAAEASPASKHQRKIQQLGDLDGEAFDTAYTETLVEMHRNDIELFEQVAQSDDYSQPIRNYAQRTLGDLRQHLQVAQRLHEDPRSMVALDDLDADDAY